MALLRAVVASGMAARIRSGWCAAHSSTCIPPIEPPTTHSSRSMPRWSISRSCARTMSPMVTTGKRSPYGLPVAGLMLPGPVEP